MTMMVTLENGLRIQQYSDNDDDGDVRERTENTAVHDGGRTNGRLFNLSLGDRTGVSRKIVLHF